eukprot:Gregarina_sp_Poly_1__10891@NODE_84_length_15393_cov_100_561529_g72_i0_p4_GENE_NODE_84_length_15393_cov_100_561529_g72_i0NODE_84_length_15393_cov_100_561529_g72_i0_p4_ORF_typecomplete_len291_score27_88_NODE_84_length_15393_cov_100_561529_g72_i016392511
MRAQVLLAVALFCEGTHLFDPTGSFLALILNHSQDKDRVPQLSLQLGSIFLFCLLILGYPLGSSISRVTRLPTAVATIGFCLHASGWFAILAGKEQYLRIIGAGLTCLATGLCYTVSAQLILPKSSRMTAFGWQLWAMTQVHINWFIPWLLWSRITTLSRLKWLLGLVAFDLFGVSLAFYAEKLPARQFEDRHNSRPGTHPVTLRFYMDESDFPSDWGLGIKNFPPESRLKKHNNSMPLWGGIVLASLWEFSAIFALLTSMAHHAVNVQHTPPWILIIFSERHKLSLYTQ